MPKPKLTMDQFFERLKKNEHGIEWFVGRGSVVRGRIKDGHECCPVSSLGPDDTANYETVGIGEGMSLPDVMQVVMAADFSFGDPDAKINKKLRQRLLDACRLAVEP